jgi:uncharacterized protein YjbI with pentapeptide repeats
LANPKHLAKIKQGVKRWNQWRRENPDIRPDLSGADLEGAKLMGADLSGVHLSKAKLMGADLSEADLFMADVNYADLRGANLVRIVSFGAEFQGANLRGADLLEANLEGADFVRANLQGANLCGAYLEGSDLSGADLSEANLDDADLREANLVDTNLSRAHLNDANLGMAYLPGADLHGADLAGAILVLSDLCGANLTDCSVFGASVWNVNLEGAIQSNLRITLEDEFPIHVDNLEVAQFIYLLLNNEKIRSVIDTITSKVVLILGRFTPDRKVVLDAIREELRKRDYLPVLFDFEKPASKDLTGTISTLANMARFIIADLTDPSSVPHELATVVPGTVVPVQTIVLEGQREYAMFVDLKRRYHWVLNPHQYKSKELLIAELGERVIDPAEAKAKELAPKK